MKALHVFTTLAFLAIITTQWMGISWKNETLLASHQPIDIDYKSFDPYTLRIVKQHQTIGSRLTLIIAKDIEPSYGYAIYYPENTLFQADEINIAWSEEGIVVTTGFGTQIIIPKEGFIGGR